MNHRKGKAVLSSLLLLSSALAGCRSIGASGAGDSAAVPAGKYAAEDWDTSWNAAQAVRVSLNGDTIQVNGTGAIVEGNTLAILSGGTYVLTGTLNDGQILIRTEQPQTVRLVLNGVQITNTSSAPIYVQNAGKVIITLADGSQNVVTDGSVYQNQSNDEPNAAIFSKDDLTINGSGLLHVNANFNDGIRTQDNLVVTGGTLVINAVNDGLRGRDSVSIAGGDFTITAGGDGIQSNNDEDADKGWIAVDGGTFNITAGQDGMQAETTLTVTGGDLNLVTGGGSANASLDSAAEFMPGRGQWNWAGGTGTLPRTPPPSSNGAPSDAPTGGTPGLPPDAFPDGMPAAPPVAPWGAPDDGAPGAPPSALPDGSATDAVDQNPPSDSAKGLKAGKSLVITGGTITVDSLDDALHSDGTISIQGGTITISTGDDGIHADEALTIDSGSIEITQSYEGLEAQFIALNGGTINLTAQDDGVNAAGGVDGSGLMGRPGGRGFGEPTNSFLRITGGLLVVDARGDGIDINGSVEMTGGTVLVSGPTNNANGPLDYAGTFNISGGTLVAAGSAGMAMTPSSTSTQPSLMVHYSSTQPAGTLINLSTADGTSLITFAPTKEYQTAVISTPELAQGETYVLSSGGTAGNETSGDLVAGGNSTGGTVLTQVTLSDVVTTISDDGSPVTGGFGRGGMGGGGMRHNTAQDPGQGFPGRQAPIRDQHGPSGATTFSPISARQSQMRQGLQGSTPAALSLSTS